MNRPRLTLLVASLFVVFTFVVAFASPAVAGSDSPTPYTVAGTILTVECGEGCYASVALLDVGG